MLHLRALSRDTSQDDKEIFDVRESIYDSYNTFEHPCSKNQIDVEFTFPASRTLILRTKQMLILYSQIFFLIVSTLSSRRKRKIAQSSK